MQVTETLNEGLKRGYTLVVTASELDAKVDEKLAEAAPEIEMKGFRKGKVPMALLKKQFGERLMGEAMQESVDGAMSKHLEETGDRPAMQPKLEMKNQDWKPGQDVEVEMTYEALPDIPEVDYKKIKLEKLVVEVEDTAVTEALEKLAENAQNFEERDADAKSENGDQVVIDFLGKVDGVAFEGGAADDFPLVLGSGQFIPGFEEQLVGLKASDKKTVEVTFPESYGKAELAGKPAEFDVTVKAVKAPKPAEIDDELAKKFGVEDLETLKNQVTEQISGEYAGAARAVMKRGLLDALDTAVSFDLPPTLVETEADQIAQQLWHEENPEAEATEKPEIETTDSHKELAARRVRLGLLLAEIGQKAEVKVTDAEMTQAVMNQARQYPGQERQFFEFVQKNPQMRQQLQAPIFEDKVVDHVFELVDVTDKTTTKEQLEEAVQELDDET